MFCDLAVKDEWSETTIRAVAQYDITDTRNVYVSYSEGYKAGNVARYECVPAYSLEFVDAYEVGYKAVFSGGRTNLSLALFHYDYSDFQLNQTIGIAVVTRNAGDTQVQGAEIELSSLLNENWSVSAAVTLLDTQYDDFTNVDGMKPELGFQNVEGNPLNKAPDTSINLGVSYTTAAPWGGRLALYGDAAYRSRTYFREFKEKEDSQGAYTIVSLNAIWES